MRYHRLALFVSELLEFKIAHQRFDAAANFAHSCTFTHFVLLQLAEPLTYCGNLLREGHGGIIYIIALVLFCFSRESCHPHKGPHSLTQHYIQRSGDAVKSSCLASLRVPPLVERLSW
jgi:hypothetical protein